MAPSDMPSDMPGASFQEPSFPPLLSGRRAVPGHGALEGALAGVAARELGAGDVIWTDDPASVELAIVLEPDIPLVRAVQMLPMTMVATADCIGALAPPQVGVMLLWPNEIRVNGASVGHVQTVVATCEPEAIPDWLVVAVSLRLKFAEGDPEPGHRRNETALAEEGCDELSNIMLIESFTRHFLTWLNNWQDEGFKPVHQSWLERAEGRDSDVTFAGVDESRPVRVVGLDEDGNLIAKRGDGTHVSASLLDAVSIGAQGRSK